MTYDVLNIDGDPIGTYDGALWSYTMVGGKAWDFWPVIKDWPYFKSYPSAVQGKFTFKTMTITGHDGTELPGVAVTYDMDVAAIVCATLVPRENGPGLSDLCRRCKLPGEFVRMSLVCPKCHAFIGGC